jgi:hypothetical protein
LKQGITKAIERDNQGGAAPMHQFVIRKTQHYPTKAFMHISETVIKTARRQIIAVGKTFSGRGAIPHRR